VLAKCDTPFYTDPTLLLENYVLAHQTSKNKISSPLSRKENKKRHVDHVCSRTSEFEWSLKISF
jgi:hypothetical protein